MAVAEIEHLLRDSGTTKFFIEAARDPGWPLWLDDRGLLSQLFVQETLSEKDGLLGWWLASNYARKYSTVIQQLLARHSLKVNADFWWRLCGLIASKSDNALPPRQLRRWVALLLASAPEGNGVTDNLSQLASLCAMEGETQTVLQIFLFMSSPLFGVETSTRSDLEDDGLQPTSKFRATEHTLTALWTRHLRDSVPTIAQQVLDGMTTHLTQVRRTIQTWESVADPFDSLSFGRSAIEVHEQDQFRSVPDALIDAARDSLEWLVHNRTASASSWIETNVESGIPILRRLAIHGAGHAPSTSDNEKLAWICNIVGLHNASDHHEVFRFVARAYPGADVAHRRLLVATVQQYHLPATTDYDDQRREGIEAHHKYSWFEFLLKETRDCGLLLEALAPIRSAHPEWTIPEHPDLTHWSGPAGWVGNRSPWSADELSHSAPDERLTQLLEFRGDRWDGPDRAGLTTEVQKACTSNPDWAFGLASELSLTRSYETDLWPAIIRGLSEAELSPESWLRAAELIGVVDIFGLHGNACSDFMHRLVGEKARPFALDVLDAANEIARRMWRVLSELQDDEQIDAWTSTAINRPTGILVEFFIGGLSLLTRDKEGPERRIPPDYLAVFEEMLEKPSNSGGFARALLGSQVGWLFSLNSEWSRQRLIPLFAGTDPAFSQAWDGFLTWGRIYSSLADEMFPAFRAAIGRLSDDSDSRRRRLIEFVAQLSAFYAADPIDDPIPTLFRDGTLADRITFAHQIAQILRSADAQTKADLWDRWLFRYWRNRLDGVPAPLERGEIAGMLSWIPLSGDRYPDAVGLTSDLPSIELKNLYLTYPMRNSEIVSLHPEATARFLIYLASCDVGYHADDLAIIAGRLDRLPDELNTRMREALAAVGTQPRAADPGDAA
jgi:hypothetical protein